MSTRACYRFSDSEQSFVVYKHYDGYPEGAVCWITKAVPFAWPLPRFEPDEFAAAFIAGQQSSNETKLLEAQRALGHAALCLADDERLASLGDNVVNHAPGGRYTNYGVGGESPPDPGQHDRRHAGGPSPSSMTSA